MAKTPLIARIGAALTAFSGQPENRSALADAVVQKGSAWPFNRVPVIDGAAGGVSIHQPYAQSAWVMRAIKEVAGPISAIDLKAMVGWLKLSGECFVILPLEFTVPFPDRVAAWPQLLLARPAAMRAEKGSTGELLAWIYTGRNGVTTRFLPEQVIQPKFWNPYDDLRGMSEYEAAHVATEADYLSGRFALNIARANGDTGVVITVKGGAVPDDAQQEQIRNSLRLKAQKSQRGEFSSVFIPGDLEVQDPKIKSPDAQFVAQRLENRHEIYIALGVPPSMADVTQSYSIGSASDRYCRPFGASGLIPPPNSATSACRPRTPANTSTSISRASPVTTSDILMRACCPWRWAVCRRNSRRMIPRSARTWLAWRCGL
ncbi:MAG: phage portal protein [Verrucomicrobia bacterium]|nr:phage portal protein [Verrucomicrobiota bacterium]